MKILARQLTVDMYDCKNKNLNDYMDLKDSLEVGMNMAGFTPIEVRAQIFIFAIVHIYCQLSC